VALRAGKDAHSLLLLLRIVIATALATLIGALFVVIAVSRRRRTAAG